MLISGGGDTSGSVFTLAPIEGFEGQVYITVTVTDDDGKYYFMILFMWKFLMLFGGHGPRYFMYEESHSCHETWFWHFTFLNNILPWK